MVLEYGERLPEKIVDPLFLECVADHLQGPPLLLGGRVAFLELPPPYLAGWCERLLLGAGPFRQKEIQLLVQSGINDTFVGMVVDFAMESCVS